MVFFSHDFLPEPLRKRIFQFPAIDTIGHLTSFFILTWVSHSLIKLPLSVCIPLLAFYAALTEIGQSFLGYRNAEWGDFIADIIGISLFVIAKWAYIIFFKRQLNK